MVNAAGRQAAIVLLMTGGLLSPFASRAQEAADSVDTLHVTSRLVVLDVRVVDRQGKFVSGLDRTQFEVLEGKARQTIRDFEGPAAHTMPKPGVDLVNSTADLVKIGNAPVNVIVIDELNTAFSDTARAQQALADFLKKQPAVLPVPTLFLASGASRVTVLHDFTQNRQDLLDSMKKHVTDVDFQALSNQLNGGTMAASNGFAKTLGALSQVASSLRGIPGHKNVIWVGTGFDNAYDLTSASDSDAQKIEDALSLVTKRMLDARMSVSTLDPAGMDANQPEDNIDAEATSGEGPTPTTNFAQGASFDELAESTGGIVVHGRNDLSHLIAADMNAASDYYTLTYTPTSTLNVAQEFREIHVVMRDPSLRAITRTGYFANDAPEAPVHPEAPKLQPREFKYDMLSAGGSHMVYTGLHVSATPTESGFDVSVEASDLMWKPDGDANRVAELSVLGAAFDGKDKTLAQDAKELRERIKNTDNVHGTRIGFSFDLRVPMNAKRVRIVVRDAGSGTIGSVDLPR